MTHSNKKPENKLQWLLTPNLSPCDALPQGSLKEKVISLLLDDRPTGISEYLDFRLDQIAREITTTDTSQVKVVLFGGGTGLSNIVGGDSRLAGWYKTPFIGLKEVFPKQYAIVCITDDGGSTGELLKSLPIIALGDIRRVMLSAIQKNRFANKYKLNYKKTLKAIKALHSLFNHRFNRKPQSPEDLLSAVRIEDIPTELASFILRLTSNLFIQPSLIDTLSQPQCFGNLIIAASICEQAGIKTDLSYLSPSKINKATINGIAEICDRLSLDRTSIIPSTITGAGLNVLYENGVMIRGEDKSSRFLRGYPVDRVFVEFNRRPELHPDTVDLIKNADIMIFAPGSLYTSITPIMQTPKIAEAIRSNSRAMKLLIANIWVQKGETDAARNHPERKFHISDLIKAYQRNIPGGIKDIFSHIITLDLKDIPSSAIQKYALEQKEPIYLDKEKVEELGIETITAPIFSRKLLKKHLIIQHDPHSVSIAVKALYKLHKSLGNNQAQTNKPKKRKGNIFAIIRTDNSTSCHRLKTINEYCHELRTYEIVKKGKGKPTSLDKEKRNRLINSLITISWKHHDIQPDHFKRVRGITLISPEVWDNQQKWENIISFYEPGSGLIKVRNPANGSHNNFELACLIGLGQSLLGNYSKEKEMADVMVNNSIIGQAYILTLQEEKYLNSYLSLEDIKEYLSLVKMSPHPENPNMFTRLVSGKEGFTPPGIFFGLCYAWYLDNRLAPNIEYKMSIMKKQNKELLPEQIKLRKRRENVIKFFRQKVFQHHI